MKKPSLIVCFILVVVEGFSQVAVKLQGNVTDTAGIGLANATLTIINTRDSLNFLTDENGFFVIAIQTPPQIIKLYVTMKGYRPYQDTIHLNRASKIKLIKPIVLHVDYSELDPVTVIRVKPITLTEDTITYHGAAFKVRDGAETEQLMKMLPGVEVDQDGNVIVQGRRITKVMIDGKLYLGGDVTAAIRNLPAEIVDKIQVIADYGDKARLTGMKFGQPLKVLNIILKRERQNGQIGQLQIGYGGFGKYIDGVSGNSFNGPQQISFYSDISNNSPAKKNVLTNLGIGYADMWSSKWKAEGSVEYQGNNVESQDNIIQDNYYVGGQMHQEQSNQNKGNGNNANLTGILTFVPSEFESLRLNPTFSFQQSNQSANSIFSTTQNSPGVNKSSDGISIYNTASTAYSIGLESYFEKLSRATKRRFSVNMNVHYSGGSLFNDDQIQTSIVLDSQKTSSLQRFIVKTVTPSWNTGIVVNYFTPIGKHGFAEIGYAWNNSFSRSSKVTQKQDSLEPAPLIIDSLSRKYNLVSGDQRFHIGYMASIGKFIFSLGSDLVPGNLNGTSLTNGKPINYHYFSLLPFAQCAFTFVPSKRVSFQYNGNNSLPSLQQVQPVIDLTNPQYPVIGNPSLKPAYTHNLSLHYEQSSLEPTQYWGFGIDLGLNVTLNPIIQNTVHPKDSSIIIQSIDYLNAGSSHTLSSGYHLTLPSLWKKTLKITLNGQILTGSSIAMSDFIASTISMVNITQSVHFQSCIPNKVDFDLACNYNYVHTKYQYASEESNSFISTGWVLNDRYYFLKNWAINCQLSQSYTALNSGRFQENPCNVMVAIQRELLHKNRGKVSFSVYDLLNTGSGYTQSFSATSTTRSQFQVTGRYFMILITIKVGKFKR